MGLLTVDVTSGGVVMTSDSQPIRLTEGAVEVLESKGVRRRDPMIQRKGTEFGGLLGFVGTEKIGSRATREVLEKVNGETTDLGVHAFRKELAARLSDLWREHGLESCLWVFVAGSVAGEPHFSYVVNGTLGAGNKYWDITPAFKEVNDLDETHVLPLLNEYGTKANVLAHRAFAFRNGALEPAFAILNDYTAMMERLYSGGYEGFSPEMSLDDYAALVRVRQEFVKRLFDPSKGVWRGAAPPIGGEVYARLVDTGGVVSDHPKHAV
jgi:hypothetical protein